jgi:hypothetical protein
VSIATPSTDEFLEYNELMEVRDSVVLIMRFVSAINWRSALTGLGGLPSELLEGMLNAMDQDR